MSSSDDLNDSDIYIYTIDSPCIAVIYDMIAHTAQQLQLKTSIRFALMNDTPYLALTGELWVGFDQYDMCIDTFWSISDISYDA